MGYTLCLVQYQPKGELRLMPEYTVSFFAVLSFDGSLRASLTREALLPYGDPVPISAPHLNASAAIAWWRAGVGREIDVI